MSETTGPQFGKNRETYLNPDTYHAYLAENDALKERFTQSEKPAVKRNFQVEVATEEDGSVNSLLLKKQNGDEFDMFTVLPEGTKLKTGISTEFTYQPKSKEVSFNYYGVRQSQYGLMNLCHEIGHAYCHEEPKAIEKLVRALEILTRGLSKVESVIGIEDEELAGFVLQALSKGGGIGVSDKRNEFAYQHSARDERNSWAVGLRILRTLETLGYDVFAGFDTKREVLEFVNLALQSYDLHRETSRRIVYDNDTADYQPIFTKKYVPKIGPEKLEE